MMHDHDHAQFRARMDRDRRLFAIAWWTTILVTITAAVWLLTHPEAIGTFVGRIAAGFKGAAS